MHMTSVMGLFFRWYALAIQLSNPYTQEEQKCELVTLSIALMGMVCQHDLEVH